ncbi:bacteriocin immunity protein, partial [Escherichia coli]|uniref:bacteriocin immunity protein n=2 Tax=Bacteria TaxID=2 RepID=UPI00200C855F
MTKREKESNEILSQIYNLVLNPDINTYERTPLLNAKNRLEKNEYFPRVMRDLEFDLRPYAIK